ncbi:MAG: hypothetical protein AAFV77_05405, partial [Planctomycetota bacterium]
PPQPPVHSWSISACLSILVMAVLRIFGPLWQRIDDSEEALQSNISATGKIRTGRTTAIPIMTGCQIYKPKPNRESKEHRDSDCAPRWMRAA